MRGGRWGRGRGSLRLTREITGAVPSSGLPSVPGPLPGLLTSERGVSAHGRLSCHRAGGGSRSAAVVQEPRKSRAAARAKLKEKQAHWACGTAVQPREGGPQSVCASVAASALPTGPRPGQAPRSPSDPELQAPLPSSASLRSRSPEPDADRPRDRGPAARLRDAPTRGPR